MIDRDKAKVYVRRFAGKQGFPKEFPDAIDALIDAMQKAPHDEAHAKLIAEELEIETHFCPEPSEVWRMARITATKREAGCDACGHTGWVPVIGKAGRTGVKPCACRSVGSDDTGERRGRLRSMKEIAG